MAGWTPVTESSASAWKPVAEAPKPAATHGDRLKGTPTNLPDNFMGTLAKDFAALPEGVWNAATHPIDTVKGAVRQLLNLPGDVVTDISQGNWGKLAAKATELAVPALSTERGAAAAGAAGAAVKDAAAGVGTKAAEIAANPVAREVIGIVSPRAKNALAAFNRVKTAAEKSAAEDAAATAAPEAAAAASPGEMLARANGQDWASLSADDKGMLESVAKARQNASAQPPRPPMGPPQAPPEAAPAAPAAPSKTLSQMIQDEYGGRSAEEAPAPVNAEMIGANPVTPIASRGVPVRPPLRSAVPQPEPAQVAPTPQVSEPAAPAPPAPRSMAQTEAAMAQKQPAPIDISEARSQFDVNGERKSPQLRGAEKTAINRTAKAQRFAEQMHEKGVTAEMAAQIESGMLSDTQLQQGMVPRWGNVAQQLGENAPSELSVPEIIRELRKLESAKAKPAASPASKRAAGGGMGGMKNYFAESK